MYFQHATGSNYAEPVLPLTRIKEKLESRARGVHLCIGSGGSCTGGLSLLLQSDIVVPGAHMMDESPCERSTWLILSLQQTQSGFLHTVATSVLQHVCHQPNERSS